MTNGDNERLDRVVQSLEQMLAHFDTRLNSIENRLGQLESNRNIILDERRVAERPGHLGGRTIYSSPTGGIEREFKVLTCDTCGRRIEEEFIICQECGRKLCDSCAISYQNTNLCVNCLRNVIPLTKQAYKVLVALANEVQDVRTISKITRMIKDDVVNARNHLLALRLIMKRGFSIFSEVRITDSGLEAIGAYRQVFGQDDDVIQFDIELRNYLAERRN